MKKPQPSQRVLTEVMLPKMLQRGYSVEIYASNDDLEEIWKCVMEFGSASFWGRRDAKSEEDEKKSDTEILFSPQHIEVIIDKRWDAREIAEYFEHFFDEPGETE